MNKPTLDCILIGHNEGDFQDYVARQRLTAGTTGAYNEVQTNSILFKGRRITYMDLLNYGLSQATGEPWHLSSFGPTNLASCYLGNFLRRCGLSAEIVNTFQTQKELLADLLAEPHRAVAITTTFYVEPTPIREIVELVRAHSPESTIIVGGPHIFNTCAANDLETQDFIFDWIGADVYVTESQGELTLSRVLMALRQTAPDLGAIENLIYRDGDGSFRRTDRLPEDNVLDENSIDWSQFDRAYLEPMTLVRTARSCAFSCSFCNYPRMAGALKLADVSVVEKELRQLDSMGVRYVHFIDDTFNVPIRRFKDLCRMIIRNKFSFRWMSFLRCSNVDEEAIDLMAESGCFGSLLGIESGDNRVLTNMNKRAAIDQYVAGLRKLNSVGITTYGMFFVGFPGETDETAMNTFRFIQENAPTFFVTGLWFDDTLAPVQDRAEELGIVGAGYNWKHHTMDWRQGVEWVRRIYREVTASTIMPLTGFSFETIPYLLGLGMPLEEIKKFAAVAHRMLVASLDDEDQAFEAEERQLISICSDIAGRRRQPLVREAG